MTAVDLILKSTRVLTADGMRAAAVHIGAGRIRAVTGLRGASGGARVEDLGDLLISPGLVDCHVHINEPGRTEWEGFATATQAAAAGGITTVVDMPLNCIPVTTSAAALAEKLRSVTGKLWVDCGFFGGVVSGGLPHLPELIEAGVLGVKAFLIDSGIDEFPNVALEDLEHAMPVIAAGGIPLLVHAELQSPTGAYGDPASYRAYLASRPRAWENDAIGMMIDLCRRHRCPTHIVHLSCADALPAILAARNEGLPFTAETCPHYLTLCAESIPDGDPRYKCAPPIREAENRERLWRGLDQGVIDFIVSDHSPCTPSLKLLESGDVKNAWGGIAGLQFGLPLVWTEARERGFGPDRVAAWMSERTAAFVGLEATKGKIQAGMDADLVVWDPERGFQLEAGMVRHRHKVTPYLGRNLFGKVHRTYLRGNLVFQDGHPRGGPLGRPLTRNPKG